MPQFSVALMQMCGAVATEVINIILICSHDSTKDVIMNLLAFGVIAEIDDYYADSLKNSFTRELISEGELSFSKLGKDDKDPLEVNKAWVSKFIYFWYRVF